MAETLKIPNETIDSEWRDDIDVDYAIYGNDEKKEREFVSPKKVSKEAAEKITEIKSRNLKIGMLAKFLREKDVA